MIKTFRLKLFFILLIFALVISVTITIIDFLKMKETIIEHDNFQIEHAEKSALNSLQTMNKAFYLLDQETAKKMEDVSLLLQERYDDNQDFTSWDFDYLAKSFGMDIYIINNASTIEYSNVESDIGLDFSECCATLNEILETRRDTGQLYIDEMDIEQESGEIKKFSYMATNDKKYLIELGYNLQDEKVFNEFNFLNVIKDIEKEFDSVTEMNVFAFSVIPYGKSAHENVSKKRRKAVRKARDTYELVEMDGTIDDKPVIYRYIPYVPKYQSEEQPQVVEIVYSKSAVSSILQENKRTFFIQIFVIILLTCLVAFIISNWFAKPVQMAFTDSLTGLKNRAAFDNEMKQLLLKPTTRKSLLMVDLDNFKNVNDLCGHSRGDQLLKITAQKLEEVADNNAFNVYRFGGDEFAIIMENQTKDEIEVIVRELLNEVEQIIEDNQFEQVSVSLSVGISSADELSSSETLFKRADKALYMAKAKGRNKYQFYEENDRD